MTREGTFPTAFSGALARSDLLTCRSFCLRLSVFIRVKGGAHDGDQAAASLLLLFRLLFLHSSLLTLASLLGSSAMEITLFHEQQTKILQRGSHKPQLEQYETLRGGAGEQIGSGAASVLEITLPFSVDERDTLAFVCTRARSGKKQHLMERSPPGERKRRNTERTILPATRIVREALAKLRGESATLRFARRLLEKFCEKQALKSSSILLLPLPSPRPSHKERAAKRTANRQRCVEVFFATRATNRSRVRIRLASSSLA
ncbi:hypothetical protein BJY59DRAFT_347383 [Rhodotorula toruloides]